MKNAMVVCGVVLLGLGSTAIARGRPSSQKNGSLVVTHLEATTSAVDQGTNLSLALKLDVQVRSTVGSDVTLTAVTACKVNDETKTDTTELGGELSDLNPGETKHFEASPFASSNLGSPPGQCSITIRQNQAFGNPRDIARFCYASGKVTQGACR